MKTQQVPGSDYHASAESQALTLYNLHELEAQCQPTLPPAVYGYIRGGAEDEMTLRRNFSAWDNHHMTPRMLQGVENVDTRTSLLGIDLAMPIIAAPVAAQKACHVQGELAAAKALASVGSLYTISTYSSALLSDIGAAGQGGPQFFQIYMSKKDDFNAYIVEQAVNSGAKAIVLTADATVGGHRESDMRHNFTFPFALDNLVSYAEQTDGGTQGMTLFDVYKAGKQNLSLDDIALLKKLSGLPVFVKGIQHPEDAHQAIESGADGIWVSNHGGRQVDGALGSFDYLPSIAQRVAKRVPIVFDSGVRRGSHVFKALASGADVVAIGRPMVYGLHLGGEQGVSAVFNHLNKELAVAMQLAGTQTIAEVQKAELLTTQ